MLVEQFFLKIQCSKILNLEKKSKPTLPISTESQSLYLKYFILQSEIRLGRVTLKEVPVPLKGVSILLKDNGAQSCLGLAQVWHLHY